MRRAISILAALVLAAAVAKPLRAMDAYWVEPAFKEIPARGPSDAKGLVIWNHGLAGGQPQYQTPAPAIVAALAAWGWDAIRLNRNPTLEGTWGTVGMQHVDRLVDEANTARNQGYSRIILAGQSYGGAIALAAAGKMQTYGVIALAPGIGQIVRGPMNDITSEASKIIEKATYDQVEALQTSRAMFYLPTDDEFAVGIDRAPHVRELMGNKDQPFILIDKQVHTHSGAYLPDFNPYAACAVAMFDPDASPHPSEFKCEQDEIAQFLSSVGLDSNRATSGWFGYTETSGQAIAVLEHEAYNGITVDLAWGNGMFNRFKPGYERGIQAKRDGDTMTLAMKNGATITLQAQGTTATLTSAKPGQPDQISAKLVAFEP